VKTGLKKILHIIDSLAVGGAERLLVSVINNLPEFEHHLVILSDKADLLPELDPGCRVTKLGFRSKKDSFRCIRRIRKYIIKQGIEIVHSHLVMANIFARLAAPRGIPVFNSLHNLNGEKLFSTGFSWQRIVEKRTYRKKHHIIAVSQQVLDDYKKFIGIKGRATVLHNFVDNRFFAAAPRKANLPGPLRTIAVGSFKPQKNYPFLVEAFRRLPAGITLDIYGDGPLKKEIEAKIREYGVTNIRLRGIHQQVEHVFRDYDLYIMSSTMEGHPIALLEAMAAGMPVLVSDIPVLREATNNHSLYFNLDSTDDFIRKISDIAAGKTDLDHYAAYNLDYAGRIARKDHYLERLRKLYLSEANPPDLA